VVLTPQPVAPIAPPTRQPVVPPTSQPVASQTFQPVVSLTVQPVASPTLQPALTPTSQPLASPTPQPVVPPTSHPVGPPAPQPVIPPTPQPVAPIDIVDTIPDSQGYELVYELDPIPVQPNFATEVGYTRQDLNHPPFSRVAYFIELDGAEFGHQWAWVSMDAFTDNVAFTGVPCPVCDQGTLQQSVTNVHVVSNVPDLHDGTSLAGNIEFWPYNYAPENGADIYDCEDTAIPNESGIGYGSMQVHVENPLNLSGPRQTVFAFNGFNRGRTADLGIGRNANPDGQPDWTFSANADTYTVRKMQVYVKQQGPPEPTISPAPTLSPKTSSPVSSMTTVVTLGASGVDTITHDQLCPSQITEELLIDGAAYTNGVGTVTLYQCSSVGFDPMKIKLINFPIQDGLWFEIKNRKNDVNLVIKSLADYSEYSTGGGYSGEYPFQESQEHYPEFSWNHVSKWVSYRKMPAQWNKPKNIFTQEEIEWIANNNYMSWFGLESVDYILELAKDIKQVNPKYKQLLYWNSYGYRGVEIDTFNEDWLQYEMINGKRVHIQKGQQRYYNHSIPEMRQWWIDHALKMTSHKLPNGDRVINGVFSDATRSDIGTDHSNMIEELQNALPADCIKMGNFLRQKDAYRKVFNEGYKRNDKPHNGNRWRLAYADGSYLENVHENRNDQPVDEAIIVSMQLAREGLWKGKIIFWNGAPFNCLANCDDVTEADMSEYIKPTLAEYLIIAEKYGYYNFLASPVAGPDNERYIWETSQMDEFTRPLGEPQGPPVRVGNKFTRHFGHVSVMLTVGVNGVNEGTYNWASMPTTPYLL